MERYRVALSADFQKSDGSSAFPSFDLSPLDADPHIEWAYVPLVDGRIPAEDMAGFDALILLAGRFDADSLPGDGRLSLVARFGVGYDNVDVAACSASDVAVVITPSGVRRPVAVAILTFILALSGRLLIKDRLTRSGPDGWAQRGAHMGQGLVGLTLGSIGIGNIGAEMFKLAAPLGMNFIGHDPYTDPAVAGDIDVELVPIDQVFRNADFVCINCPLTDETEGLVDADKIALMKPTAFLINTARGPIVDQAALTDALAAKRIAGAGLDVFANEPSSADDPLFSLDNVIVSPHAICWTDQCFAGIGAADIQAAKAVLAGDIPEGIVNRDITANEHWLSKLAGYRDRFG